MSHHRLGGDVRPEPFAELAASSEEAGLDCPQRDADDLGHIAVGQTLQIAQDEHQPEVGFEAADGLIHHSLQFTPANQRFRRVRQIRLFSPDAVSDLDRVIGGVWYQGASAVNPFLSFYGRIDRDLAHPCGDLAVAPIVGQCPVHPDEDILRQVSGLVKVADNSQDHTEDLLVVAADQRVEVDAGSDFGAIVQFCRSSGSSKTLLNGFSIHLPPYLF